ncbi:MAG TPA: hypothetical protein VJZ01_09075 [Lachnospiraceae bacterium]|jgi:hypothetical protein|nr:hypothetical protein [Lachnospiraceae bacterium]
MTKQEVCTKVFKALLDEELLNEADAYDITNLQIDVECVISRVLEDYTLVYTTGIINE